jgi:hypothetical protein
MYGRASSIFGRASPRQLQRPEIDYQASQSPVVMLPVEVTVTAPEPSARIPNAVVAGFRRRQRRAPERQRQRAGGNRTQKRGPTGRAARPAAAISLGQGRLPVTLPVIEIFPNGSFNTPSLKGS